MKNKPGLFIFIIILALLLIILPVLSSVFTDFLDKYIFNLALIPDNFLLSTFKNPQTYINFFTRTSPSNILPWAVIGLFIICSLFGLLGSKNQKRYLRKDDYGSHGTSRFQSPREIKNNYFKYNSGWFLGSDRPNLTYHIGMAGAYQPIYGNLNMQIAVFGSPGSYKTTAFVLPNIFHIPFVYKNTPEKADLIITDPKCELYSLTAKYLKSQNYEVRVLDFLNLKYGDSLNPISFISGDKELMEIAEGFINSSSVSKNAYSPDPFWEKSESQLLGALIGFVKQVYPKSQQTFSEVLKLLTSQNVRDPQKAETFFTDFSVKGSALQLWNNYLLAEDKVRANILIGLATKLKLFSIPGLINITETSSIDIKKLGVKKDKPMALFILMPDNDKTFSPIINSIVTSILSQLYKTAASLGGSLSSPTYLILEEMANIGNIPSIEMMLGTMRSRRIYPMLVWQSLPQLKNRYRDYWEDLLSMCDTHLYLGINDDFTANYCSSSLGDTTIKIQSTHNKTSGILADDSPSQSQNYYMRKLLLPDECKRISQASLIISQRSLFPSILNKVQYKYWNKKDRICASSFLEDLPKISESG
ncbi:MAG: VirD4-like conjugal transfer protein, CD1115 family [Candidatus Humimicrobiaceae bacterium]